MNYEELSKAITEGAYQALIVIAVLLLFLYLIIYITKEFIRFLT